MKKNCVILVVLLGAFSFLQAMDIPEKPVTNKITIAKDLKNLETILTEINNTIWEKVSKQLFSEIDNIKDSQQLETFIKKFFSNDSYTFKQEIKNIVLRIIPAQYKTEQEIIARLFIGYVENKIKKQLYMRKVTNRIHLPKSIRSLLESRFTWCIRCPEASLIKRLSLILLLLQKVQAKFNPGDHIVYTAFASGGLMQDYLTLSELVRLGYKNITINLIDHEYHPGHENYSQKKLLISTLQQKLETLNFKTSIQEYAFNKSATIGAINVFFTAYDYVDAVKQNKKLASNILLAVDVGQDPVKTEIYKEINTFELTINETIEEKNKIIGKLLLFIPKHGPVRLYANKELPELPKKIRKEILEFAQKYKNRPNLPMFPIGLGSRIKMINPSITIPFEKKSNQYIIFHELVMEALANNSIAFLLGNNKIIEVSKKSLENKNFLTLFEETDSFYFQEALKKYKRID